ncbi:olfactory receptor 8H1-like [Tamandua tetradactyla]|uniref:olfactory receptor 8H1-like n=1 Tax=Tamandua tetradactyla TaxID=48850 RepID=UPI004054361E
MESRNNTNVPDFILMGLTDSAEIRSILFMVFLLIYLMTVLGNAGMILIIHLDHQLHTPMYFFLSHLSFLDLGNSTVIVPKTLDNLLTSNKYISFVGCFTQLYFFACLTVSEFYILSSMAYDRYVAICNPLQYPVVMSRRVCTTLTAGSYLFGSAQSLAIVLFITSLQFCNSNVISHFFCDITPILALSCMETLNIEIMIITFAIFNVMFTFITISMSYGSILSTILKISSTSGKRKAFSTCASHLLGVSIFYSTTVFIYFKPKQSYSLGRDQVASVFYTMLVPMLNPLIYSLRNREVKNALIRVMQKREGSR